MELNEFVKLFAEQFEVLQPSQIVW